MVPASWGRPSLSALRMCAGPPSVPTLPPAPRPRRPALLLCRTAPSLGLHFPASASALAGEERGLWDHIVPGLDLDFVACSLGQVGLPLPAWVSIPVKWGP